MKRKFNGASAIFLIVSPFVAVIGTGLHLWWEGWHLSIWLLAIVLYALTMLGITAGYHRLFAHRAYDAQPWVRWFMALFGGAAFQSSIYVWCRDHRIHHRFVDSDQDPYCINKGFWHAHFGWMIFLDQNSVDPTPFGRDFDRDPMIRFQHKYYLPLAISMCFGLPTLIGYFLGSWFGGLMVAGFLRMVLVQHATFFINSLCHTFGGRPYTDRNTARDSWILAFLTMGEGYHNYHHVFSKDYRNGIYWYQWDPTKWVIGLLSLVGATRSLYQVSPGRILQQRLTMQEQSLKNRWADRWSAELESQIQEAKNRIAKAQADFEAIKIEYEAFKKNYATQSKENLEALKLKMRQASLELRDSIQMWKENYRILIRNAPIAA